MLFGKGEFITNLDANDSFEPQKIDLMAYMEVLDKEPTFALSRAKRKFNAYKYQHTIIFNFQRPLFSLFSIKK